MFDPDITYDTDPDATDPGSGSSDSIAPSSTVPRRQLGRHLKELREQNGYSIAHVARIMGWSTQKVWRIESGGTAVRPSDVIALCARYKAAEPLTEALTGLALETKSRGWWHAYGDAIPAWFELFCGLEEAASYLRTYEPELIPGLFQSEAYATALFRLVQPDIPNEEIARRYGVRIGRQAILGRKEPPSPQLDVLLCETALYRRVGTAADMSQQLHRVNAFGHLPGVRVRILPINMMLYPTAVVGGNFTILDFGPTPEPSVVYSDRLVGALYLDKPEEITSYNQVWAATWDMALPEDLSQNLITQCARSFA